MSRNIEDLDPRMQPLALELVGRCMAQGLPIVITQTRRTMEEQQALYDQGRVRPGKIVTQARPGQTAHNYGLAFDVAFIIPETGEITWDEPRSGAWYDVGRIGEGLGLIWGGRWRKFPDRPHFELANWRSAGLSTDEAQATTDARG